MRRVTLASLVLALTFLGSSNGSAAAQQPGTTMKEFLIESTESELCSSIRTQLVGTVAQCKTDVRNELAKRGYKSPRRVPDLTRVLIEVKADSSNFTTQADPAPTTISPPTTTLEDIQLKNDVRVLQTQVTDIKKTLDATSTDVAAVTTGVRTLLDRPADTSSSPSQGASWLLYGIMIICAVTLALVLFGAFRGARRLENGEGRTQPLAQNPYEQSKARAALADLTALVEHDEARTKETGELRTRAETAEAELKRLNTELSKALADGKVSAEEVRNLKKGRAEAEAAHRQALEDLEKRGAGVAKAAHAELEKV